MVKYLDYLTEFEVQSKVYTFLKKNGFDVRGEVRVKRSKKHNIRRGGRFDLAVFISSLNNEKIPIAIIEVKDSDRKTPEQMHSKAEHYRFLSGGAAQYTFYANDDVFELAESIDWEITKSQLGISK